MVLIIVPLQTLISFAIAVLLNGKIRCKGFFRSSCYIPYVISAVAVTIFFMYFFVKNGPATKFFSLFGLENVSWFASTKYALAFLIIVYVWQQIGFYMVIFIGGLQEVPAELYEAAKVDGAGAWQRLTKITVPLIKNTTYLVLTFGMISAFQIFDQIAALSKQAPLGSPSGRYPALWLPSCTSSLSAIWIWDMEAPPRSFCFVLFFAYPPCGSLREGETCK